MRDGNLYLMSLDASTSPTEVQLTDVVAATEPAGAAAAGGGQRGAMGGGTGMGQRGAAGAPPQAQGGQAGLTDAQRLLREQELKLIEYLKQQAEQRQQGRGGMGGGQRGGRGGMGGPGAGAGRANRPLHPGRAPVGHRHAAVQGRELRCSSR